MKKLYLFLFVVLMALSSCERELPGKICTLEFRFITVTVKYSSGSPVFLDSVSTIIKNGGKQLAIEQWVIHREKGIYQIFNDSHGDMIPKSANTGIKFAGFIGGQKVIEQDYVVTRDRCHISLVSGPTTIIVDP